MFEFQKNYLKILILLNLIILILCIIFFKPVIQGDAPDYIEYAKQIFNLPGNSLTNDFSHRSPLYALFLGLVMKLTGVNEFSHITIILQYLMTVIVSFCIFKIFLIATGNELIGFFSGLLSTLNLSTIYFSYNILSEIIALLLFTLISLFLIKFFNSKNIKNLIYVAIILGLIVLARFNTLALPLIVFMSIFLIHFYYAEKIKNSRRFIKEIVIFILVLSLLPGLWAVYNLKKNGFFGIVPPYHTTQRWAIPSVINDKMNISDENKPVYRIFLNAKNEIDIKDEKPPVKKATLLNNKIIVSINNFFKPENNGFKLYSTAEPALLSYYKLPSNAYGRKLLWDKLKPLYKEIKSNNKYPLFKLKMFSLLYTFKYVSPVHEAGEKINLNILPDFVIIGYKISFMFITISVFIFSVITVVKVIFKFRKANNQDMILFILCSLILYFPAINFFANVLNDANRFKYPSESIIFGIFVILAGKISAFKKFRKVTSYQIVTG